MEIIPNNRLSAHFGGLVCVGGKNFELGVSGLWVLEFFRFVKEWWFLIVAISGLFFSMYKGIQSINSNLKDIIYQLKAFSEKLILSEKDRAEIHLELKDHDERLDRQKEKIIEHEQQLKTLFKERDR